MSTDPALKSDRLQGIIFADEKQHISYHRRMIDRMNQLVGIKSHKPKRPEYRHYLPSNPQELQDLLDQFKARD